MKKRKFMAGTLACAIAGSLVGCMPTQTAPADTKQEETSTAAAADLKVNTTDPITLRMNWWGGDSHHKATIEAIRAFEAKYPNIKVEAEYESFTGHEEKVALALKSGSAADVIQLNMDWVFNYSPDGEMFIDLNTLSNVIDLTAYELSDLDFFTINGKLQAIPVSNTGRVFFWNQTMFDRVGAKIPTTLDELYAAGEKFASYEDGSYYPLIVKELDRTLLMVYYLQCKYGKPWVENNELQYTQEEISEGMEFLNTLENKHVIPTLEILAGDGSELIDTNQRWIDGHYAGIYMWDCNLLKHKNAAAGFDFVVGDFINMGDYHGGMSKAAMVFAIPKTSEHPAEAAALIQFLLGEKEGIKIMSDIRGIPLNKKAREVLDLSNSVAAIANEKMAAWTQFRFDKVFERAPLKNADGTYFLTQQMLSYKQADAQECAKILMDGINEQLSAAQNP